MTYLLSAMAAFVTDSNDLWAYFVIPATGSSNLGVCGTFGDALTKVLGFAVGSTHFQSQLPLVTKTNPTISQGVEPELLIAVYDVNLGAIVQNAQRLLLSRGVCTIYNDSGEITVCCVITINT